MKKKIKKNLIILAVFQLIIVALSFLNYHNISLLSYINISFYISATLLLTFLFVFTIQTGFFDVVSKSFRMVASRGKNKRKFDEIPSLSELVSFNNKPLLFYGLVTALLMLLALGLYYGLQT